MNRYDHLGRRVQKIAPDGTHTFLYDGWRPVVETVTKPGGGTDRIEYHWGKDLSGTLDGAAGVGGLLYVKRNGTIYVPFYDAFGNVMGYWDEQGNVVAEYAYDAFGRTVVKSGTMADGFSIRYSTKGIARSLKSVLPRAYLCWTSLDGRTQLDMQLYGTGVRPLMKQKKNILVSPM